MAKSGSFSKTFNTGYKLLIEWSENNVDTANNQSDITVTAKLVTSGTYNINSSASKDISLSINGTKYSSTCTVGISGGSTKTLMTKTVSNINHNSDGSKSISISCTLGIAVTLGGSYVSSVSASGTATLTTIARKSSLSADNGTLNTTQTLTVTRRSSSFTHTITYKCGDASGTICTKSSSTSISWTPPLSLASQNTTGTSVSITFTITTYSGDSNIGSATKTISCSIPSSVKPTVSIAVSDPNGYASTYGGYVKSKSKIKVVITASGSQGSTIKSYSTSANGKTYTGSTVTTGVVASSGTLTIKTTVTDSRGRTATASTTITALDYVAPKITTMKVIRSDSSGNASASGAYLAVIFSASITSLNSKNTATYTVQYKKSTTSSYTSATASSYTGNYAPSSAKYVFSADTASSYDIILTAKDAFGSAKKVATGSSISKLWSVFSKGAGIAFGKVAELENILDIAWITFPRGGFRYPVLADGTDLNTILTPNTYSGKNASSAGYLNVPFTTGTSFSLEVISQGADGQIMQRLTTCAKTNPATYVRFYYTQAWGSWLLVSANYNWTNLTLDDAFKAYNGESNNTPKYKVSGNLVTVTGVVSPKEEYTSSNTKVPIASGIPANLRPSMAQTFICQGSSSNRWSCGVETNGTITIARYGVSGYVNVPNNAWLPFTITYSI